MVRSCHLVTSPNQVDLVLRSRHALPRFFLKRMEDVDSRREPDRVDHTIGVGVMILDDLKHARSLHNSLQRLGVRGLLPLLSPKEAKSDGAKALGVSRQALSSLLNGRAGISPDMAVRLSKAFGSSARHWMQLQMNYDLWQAEQRADELDVKRLVPA